MYFLGVVIDVSQKLRKIGHFFEIFEIDLLKQPQITFYCILIINFPIDFENSAQKFLATPQRREKPLFPIPPLIDKTTPHGGVTQPPQITLVNSLQ